MPDEQFTNPSLAALYDPLHTDRPDLGAYLDIAREFSARQILDVGCGTGTLALLLAAQGHDVTGVDPARASVDVARAKPGAERVRWLDGDATTLPDDVHVDLALMTGNAAQAVVDEDVWEGTLRGVRAALRPGGRFVFETRDPARRAWEEWTPEESSRRVEVPGVGAVETWYEVTEVALPLVTFRTTFVVAGEVLTSMSTLRFRERDEVAAGLERHGFGVEEVRGAPDRPGREFVFFARARAVVASGGES
ncbi:class I SAM-dependent methyltransferase [Streptomyces roseirectus]|uniref:Class I SAM-dependent methyltransferase n=1 Tax=Streptomyces roseirectus TaxID=2768066 RepID=A0A7H0I6J1_9ACTN|nr:class I SAM-dependent methyltransferase [Streptomyces roseirectus]QNP68407.1 class I SAM-dependent methyltransferase [Streptomyces roseirectus]